MSGKPKVFKTRQRKVAPRKHGPTKPKAFTKETGSQLQDFSDDSFSECNEKGSVDQSLLVPSELFGKDTLVESALCIAYLIKYTKDDPILHALTSKLRDEFAAEKQLVDDLEHSLQNSKEEKKKLANYLLQVLSVSRHSQREPEYLKNDLEKLGLRTGNKGTPENIKHIDVRKASAYNKLWREFHEEKETLQTPSQIYRQSDIGPRDIVMKLQDNLKLNQNEDENTMLELRLQLKQILEEHEKTKEMLNEAVQEQEFEQALRKTLDQTVREDKTIIEQLKKKCLELSLSREELCEHYIAELSKIGAAFEQTRNEKDYAIRQKQTADKKAIDLSNQSKIDDEKKQRMLNLYKQEIERRDKKIEKMGKIINSNKNNLRVENKLMMNLMEKERHQILIDKQTTKAKLGEFRSKYETEKRKSQELQKQVSECENKLKMLEYENEKAMKSEKDEKRLLARLQKNVEEKDQAIQTLKKFLEEIKSDNSKLRHELLASKAQFADKVSQLQQNLALLKETKDELQKTKNERDCEHVQRNTMERKVRELEKYNESSEKAYTERLSDQKQLIEWLETEINSVHTHAKLKSSEEMDIRSDRNNLRKELETTTDQLTKLKHEYTIAKAKLTESGNRLEYVRSETIEKKDREFEKCMDMLVNTNLEKLAKQKALINRLEIELEHTNAKLRQLEEIHVKRDTDNLRKELITIKDQFLKLKHEHELVLTKLKETEKKLDDAKYENQIQHQTRQELESKEREQKNYIIGLREANQHLKNKVKLKDSNLQELEGFLESFKQKCVENNQQQNLAFQKHVEELSELRRREEIILQELNNTRLELDNSKSELEIEKRKIKELEKRLASELEHTNVKLNRPEEFHVKSDSDNLRKELERTKDQFMKLKHEHELVVTKLKETEEKLDEANNEKQIEHHTKQQFESKALELEKYIIGLREANQHLQNEVELKDSNLQALEVSYESLKQKSIKNNQQQEIDFQNNVDKISELTRREKTFLEELNSARLQLNKSQSQTEIEKRRVKELEKRVNGYENEIKQNKDENDKIFRIQNERLAQLEKEVKKRDREQENLAKSLEQTKHPNIEQGKHIHMLTDTNEHLRNQLQIAEKKLQKTVEKEHEVTKKLERKVKEFEDKSNQLEEIRKEVISQKQRIHHLEKETACKVQTIKDLEQSLKNASSEIKHQFMQDLKETKDNLNLLKDEKVTWMKSEEEKNSLIARLEKKVEDTTSDQQKQALAKLKETEAELKAVKASNDDLQNNMKGVSELRDQLQRALSKLEATEIELEETKTRLSKAMGDKLTDNNPNIADLSDKNRPVKLAERYCELYDNEWTDAYDVLEKRFEREQHTIESLLEILQDASHFCEVNAVKQLADLQCGLQFTKAVQAENFPAGVLKQLKDCRKRMSSAAIKDLYEMYLSHLKVSHPEILKNAKDISEFVRECLELCWLMAIQDPPVVFAPVAQPGSDFNTDIFKAYTSSGKHVDYTVWPAMLLHKGGPLLCKGIAQGYGKKSGKVKSS